MSRVGIAAMKALAVGVAIAIGGAIFAYSQFDNALAQSLAITEDVTPQQRDMLEQAARDVAKTTIFSAKEAAAAYFSLFSAGQTVAQAMQSLPVVAQFAQAGMFDLQVATEHLVTAQNALGLSFEDPVKNMEQMKRVADILARADQLAVGSIEDFSDALTNRAAASMRTYNIDVEEGVAVLAAWANQGLKGKTAGEAFSIVVRDLQKAALKEADAWREADAAVYDSQGNLRNMADIVGDLEDAMVGLTDAQKKQLLTDLGFQERSQARLLQLLGTSDAIREYETAFRSAGGATQEVAEKQLDSATAQFKLLKNAIVDVFIGSGKEFDDGFKKLIKQVRLFVVRVGPSIAEAAGRFAEGVANFLKTFDTVIRHLRMFADNGKGLPMTIKAMSDNIEILVGWGEKLITFWQGLKDGTKDMIGEWAKMLPIIFAVATVLKIIGIVLGVIASPALIVAGIIAGLVVLFRHLYENSAEFRAVIAEVGAYFKNTVVPWFQDAWEIIQEAAAEFMEYFNAEILPKLKIMWDQVKETLQAAWEFIVTVFETGKGFVLWIWDSFGQEIIALLKVVWEVVSDVLLGAWQVIEGIFDFFSGLLTGDWKKMWEGLWSILKGIWQIIWGVLKGAWGQIKNVFMIGIKYVKQQWDNFWGGIKTKASNQWQSFKNWFSGVWDTFKNLWSRGWELLKTKVGTIIGGLKNVVKGPFNAVLAQIERFVNLGITGLNKLITLANKIPGVNIGQMGKISLPRLAHGGDIISQGLALVGENGPELLRLAKGAQVAPLGSTGDHFRSSVLGAPAMHIEQVVFQGTPQQMLTDWKRESKLALRGL